MATATAFEARSNFSKMVKRVVAGETITITAGRERTPVAMLVPIAEFQVKRLGFVEAPEFALTDAFWAPLADKECGYGDEPSGLM